MAHSHSPELELQCMTLIGASADLPGVTFMRTHTSEAITQNVTGWYLTEGKDRSLRSTQAST